MKFRICWMAILFFAADASAHPRLATMRVVDDSPSYDRQGYGNCCAEENGEFTVIKNMMKAGDVVFDVGANVGDWSRLAIEQHQFVRLYAFEPIPANVEIMRKNLEYPMLSIHQMAVDNRAGTKEFLVYISNSGRNDWSSLYYRPEIASYIHSKIQVPTEPLDAFCEQRGIDYIDFLKIDTEGHELAVLQGAQHLLSSKAITVIQFEYGGTYPDAKITLKQVYDLLTGYGYTIYRILPDRLLHVKQWRAGLENFTYSNYVAVLA